jgi:hypothetical protein
VQAQVQVQASVNVQLPVQLQVHVQGGGVDRQQSTYRTRTVRMRTYVRYDSV